MGRGAKACRQGTEAKEGTKEVTDIQMSRVWAMPSGNTFSIAPIAAFVRKYTTGASAVADPFARDSQFGTITNDLNPETKAMYHMDAEEFAKSVLLPSSVDVVLFDPPYSPLQISELYQKVGLPVTTRDTQSPRLYKAVRDGLTMALRPGGTALSFGWNSVGFGKGRGFEMLEIMLVSHGGAHNDTICVAERKLPA